MNQSVFGYFLTNFSYFYFNIRLTTMNWNLWHNVGQTLVTEILSSMIVVEEQVNHLLEIQKKILNLLDFAEIYSHVGQNLGYMNSTNPRINKVKAIKDLILLWYNEVALFNSSWLSDTQNRLKPDDAQKSVRSLK